jgi:Phytanoyl-CoA dioxygenase (PhyH)
MPESSSKIGLQELRIIAEQKIRQLHDELSQSVQCDISTNTTTVTHNNSINIPSWISQHRSTSVVITDKINTKNDNECDTATRKRSDQCLFFDYTGFIHVPNFVSSDTYQSMKEEIHHIVETQWHPEEEQKDDDETQHPDKVRRHQDTTFGTDEQQNLSRGDYFLESANRVHFFTEPKAMENIPQVMDRVESATNECTSSLKSKASTTPRQRLKSMYRTPETKIFALNKIGHALHRIPDSTFQRYTMSDTVRDFVQDLGWCDPVVPQSMYIFKQPNQIGGTVQSHQDSTFLYTTPYPTCLGLWLALDDATIENGCLWVRPCSHNYPHHDDDTTTSTTTTIPQPHQEPQDCSSIGKISTTSSTSEINIQQKHNVRRQYRRNELYFDQNAVTNGSSGNPKSDNVEASPESKIAGTSATMDQHQQLQTEEPQPLPSMFEMVTIFHDPSVPWDGSIPGCQQIVTDTDQHQPTLVDDSVHYDALVKAGFIPIECKAGDLLAFTGTLDHLSLGNSQPNPTSNLVSVRNTHMNGDDSLTSSNLLSSSSRHTFQLHLVEGPSQGIEWSHHNWLQYPDKEPFVRLFNPL